MAKAKGRFVDMDEETVKKYILEEDPFSKVCYPTQFLTYNMLTGTNVYDDSGNIIGKPRGIREGSFLVFGGQQASGKTTLALNLAGSLKKQIDGKCDLAGIKARMEIHILSTEDGMEISSIMKNCYVSEYEIRNAEVRIVPPYEMSVETMVTYITNIYNRKMEHKKDIMIKGNTVDGKTKEHMMPTVVVVDSLNTLIPEAMQDPEKLGSNMYDAQVNKELNKALINIFPKLREANIILLAISQIATKIQTDRFKINRRDYQGLDKDTKLSIPKKAEFMVDGVLFFEKVTDSETNKVSTAELMGLPDDKAIGYATCISFIKNRYGDSSARSKFHLVFDRVLGFNPYYSMLYEIVTDKLPILIKDGGKKTVEGYDGRFYAKGFAEKLKSDPVLVDLVKKKYEEQYSWILEANSKAKGKYEETANFMAMLMD